MSGSSVADPEAVTRVAVLSVFCFIALLAVIFRLWARRIQRARWGLNDYLCLVGLIFALITSIFAIHTQLYWNMGPDLTGEKNPQNVRTHVMLQVQAALLGQVLWATAVFFIRASILQLYIHLFHSTKSFRITCYVVHAINFGYFAGTVLGACLICRPLAYSWDPTIPGGSCGVQKHLDLFIGAFNLVMDVTLVALPMPVLWGLQLSMQKKLVLSAMFGMGAVICIVTLARIWVTTLIHPDSNAQKIYSMIALLTSLEALLGVINACLPVMKPIFIKFSATKSYSFLRNTLLSMSASTHSRFSRRSGGGASSFSSSSLPLQKPSRKHYQVKTGAAAGIFGFRKERQVWPSAASINPGSPDANAHRFVDGKAAQIMFSHTPTGTGPGAGTGTGKPGSAFMDTATPKPPPKSKYTDSDRLAAQKGPLRIEVKRDWDVERGVARREMGSGDEMARELLRGEKYS